MLNYFKKHNPLLICWAYFKRFITWQWWFCKEVESQTSTIEELAHLVKIDKFKISYFNQSDYEALVWWQHCLLNAINLQFKPLDYRQILQKNHQITQSKNMSFPFIIFLRVFMHHLNFRRIQRILNLWRKISHICFLILSFLT